MYIVVGLFVDILDVVIESLFESSHFSLSDQRIVSGIFYMFLGK